MRTEVLFIQEVSGAYTPPLLDTDGLKNGFTARGVLDQCLGTGVPPRV